MYDGCVYFAFCPPLSSFLVLLIYEAGHHEQGSGQREFFLFHCCLFRGQTLGFCSLSKGFSQYTKLILNNIICGWFYYMFTVLLF